LSVHCGGEQSNGRSASRHQRAARRLGRPTGGRDEISILRALVNPAITVQAEARVSIEIINGDPDTAHGLVITADHGTSSLDADDDHRHGVPGSGTVVARQPTSAGMHAGTLTLIVSNPGTYRPQPWRPGVSQPGSDGAISNTRQANRMTST